MNAYAALLGLFLFSGSGAVAAAAPACLPKVEQAWVRAAPPGATALAAYASLRNDCAEPFVVEDVSSADFAMGMIHDTRIENGVSQMRPAGKLVVPVRGTLVFSPGGRHLMLMHPVRELKPGDRVVLELKLAGGKRLRAQFVVSREPPGGPTP